MGHFHAGLENMIPYFSSEYDFIFQKSAHISGLLCLNKREKCSNVFHFLLETYFHGIFFSAERILLPRLALFFFLTAILECITAGFRTSSKRGNNLPFLKRCSLKQSHQKNSDFTLWQPTAWTRESQGDRAAARSSRAPLPIHPHDASHQRGTCFASNSWGLWVQKLKGRFLGDYVLLASIYLQTVPASVTAGQDLVKLDFC